VENVSLAGLFGSNGNSNTISTQSGVWVYIYIYMVGFIYLLQIKFIVARFITSDGSS